MVQLGDVDRRRVDAVALQPRAVVVEVGTHRTHQQRPLAQRGQPEADVGRDATATHLEAVDQERQRDAMQLVGHQLVGEPAGKLHQMVGGDRPGHGDTQLLCSAGRMRRWHSTADPDRVSARHAEGPTGRRGFR